MPARERTRRRSAHDAAGELVELGLQSASDGARLSAADGAEVDFPQSNHFGGGATDEYLVGDIELVARNLFFDDGVTQVLRECD